MCLGIEGTCGSLGQGVYSLSAFPDYMLAYLLTQSEVFGHGLEQVWNL